MLDPQFANTVIRYTQVSNTLVKKALEELTPLKADAKKAAADRNALLDRMIEAGAIQAHEKEAAAKLLSTHDGAQQVLKNAIDRIATLSQNQKEAGDLGEGVDAQKLGLDGEAGSPEQMNPNYVGQRTSVKKASDHAMLAILDDPAD